MPIPKSVIFTGHMTDLPDRPAPRFPPALESAAREAIGRHLAATMAQMSSDRKGYASAARGGDILFHEEARRLGLTTVIVLPFAPATFEETSIAGVPQGDWVARFRKLWAETPEPARVDLGLPCSNAAYALCNAEMIKMAAARGPYHLIALWDGKAGKTGGTADFVQKAIAQGDRPDIIDPAGL
jgi:hypothetical protein